jgi:hypothetical protein
MNAGVWPSDGLTVFENEMHRLAVGMGKNHFGRSKSVRKILRPKPLESIAS